MLAQLLSAMERKPFVDWSFGHYLNIAHPDFVAEGASSRRPAALAPA
jgi:hypothetical protein